MKSPGLTTLTVAALTFSSLSVAIPAQSVTAQGRLSAGDNLVVPKNARAIAVDVAGLSGPHTVRVVGPAGLDRKLRVNGDFGISVKLPGTYRLHFSDVRRGEWRYPSSYVRTVVVPAAPGLQHVAVSYRRARLGFQGVGRLRVGMSFDQARAADPSVRAELDYGCLQASSRYGDLFFNPGSGRLAMIVVKPGIRTTAGVKVGSSYARAKRAYHFKRKTLNTRKWDFIRVSPGYSLRGGREAARTPFLGVEFQDGPTKNRREFWITRSRVSSLFLDAGQQCVK